MFKIALYVTKEFVLNLFWAAGLHLAQDRAAVPLWHRGWHCPVPQGPQQCSVPVPTTHPVTASCTEPQELGRSWNSGTCPPQEQGGEGTGKETWTDAQTGLSTLRNKWELIITEPARWQMPMWPQVTERARVTPLLYPGVSTPSTR